MFTIEDLIEKIYEPKTKELFKDIYHLYSQEQYRATIVMLWTVVICDLIYKLQYLRDVYNDKTAIEVLADVKNKQEQNKKSPEWEIYLIKIIRERTKFIDDIEKAELENLQKQRNLCAHPIITNDNILFQPTKELTRALIRTALDTILLKTPLLAKEYIETILEDFAKRETNFYPKDEQIKIYFENRYLKHLNDLQIIKLFKFLWRCVFTPRNENENEKAHQFINLELLKHILKSYKSKCIEEIQNNSDSYTYDNTDTTANDLFNKFIIENYFLYKILSPQTKALFETESRPFPQDLPYFFITSLDFNHYMEKLNQEFKNRNNMIFRNEFGFLPMYLKKQAQDHGELNKFYTMCINWYSNSGWYDEANLLFSELIRPNYKYFSLENIIELLNGSSNNKQTYERARAY